MKSSNASPSLAAGFAVGLLLIPVSSTELMAAERGNAGAGGAERRPATPEKYILDYPPAEQFCPPVQTFFFEVVRTFEVVRGRRFTHQLNGGYGLPVVQKVEGKHLLHLGADVGWYRVGLPVYAAAAGVVRVSEGPSLVPDKEERGADGRRSGQRRSGRPTGALHWGNCINIEHRLPGGEYFTTVYGHLGNDRLVEVGEVVEAGQPIGTVGRKHFRVNGGYEPHLHFGVRQGRLAEPGCTLLTFHVGDKPGSMRLLQLGEEEIEVELPEGVSATSINLGGRAYTITRRDERFLLPARILRDIRNRPGFQIVGYGLSTEGWHDPVAFLRRHGADRNPAPFQRPPMGRSEKR